MSVLCVYASVPVASLYSYFLVIPVSHFQGNLPTQIADSVDFMIDKVKLLLLLRHQLPAFLVLGDVGLTADH